MPETFLARFPVSVKSLCLRPKMCRPSANTENSRRTREKPLVPRVEGDVRQFQVPVNPWSVGEGARALPIMA